MHTQNKATTENIKLVGVPRIIRIDANGIVTHDESVLNLVVNSGVEYLALRAIGSTPEVMSHMAIGSGSTAQLPTDLTLQSEITRIPFDSINRVGKVITYTATFGPNTGTGNITEAGIFNAATAGTMLARTTFGVITKQSGDTIIITWSITYNG